MKFATVGLSRCSLSTACLNVGHSLRRRAMPVFVGFHMVWPVTVGKCKFLAGRGLIIISTIFKNPQYYYYYYHYY